MWKRQLRHLNVKSVENISRRNKNHKTCAIRALSFFGSYLEISTFQIYFTNPKLKWMATCFSNHLLDLYLSKSLCPCQRLFFYSTKWNSEYNKHTTQLILIHSYVLSYEIFPPQLTSNNLRSFYNISMKIWKSKDCGG